jgi:quercetin dioxygenase-like cupin family protein
MKRRLPLISLTLALAAVLGWAADAPAPAPVVKSAGDVDWHASGSLPPGAEYHLIYEDAKTHGVQTIVRMPKGYALPPHRHTYDETIVVLKGKVVLGFGARTETVGVGGYAVIPAETPFTMKIEGFGGAVFVASFNGPFDAKLLAPEKP